MSMRSVARAATPNGCCLRTKQQITARHVHLQPCLATKGGNEPAPDQDWNAEELIQKMLTSDPEAVAQINRVTEAASRVAELQLEQARLAKALAEANGEAELDAELQQRQSEVESSNRLAEAEVQAAQLLLRAAELQAEDSAAARQRWEAEMEVNQERSESVKAGVAAAAGGTLGGLPLAAYTAPNFLALLASLGGVAGSALLFGVVYRYAVRQDAENTQLRSGVVAAFGLVRGIGRASEVLGLSGLSGSGDIELSVEKIGAAGAAMGESMLVFGFAALALNLAFRQGLVKPFGAAGGGGK